jgi:acetyltransferase-like isoleucine patch superfamily enzyme
VAISMTLAGKLITFFPGLHALLVLGCCGYFVVHPGWLSALFIALAIYIFPLICYHLHQMAAPIVEGDSTIIGTYSPWYGSHMIQLVFIGFPSCERFLRLFPGVFSVWLRLWGSKVGKAVYYTPHLELADRGLLEIGHGCVFGYNVKIACHYISPSKEKGLKLYVRKVVIEDGGFVGAASRLAPGVVVKSGALVKATVDVYPDTVVEKSS